MCATDFLRDLAPRRRPDRQACGGRRRRNTAIDAARTSCVRARAKWLWSMAHACRIRRGPSRSEAEEEGRRFYFLVNPVKLVGEGQIGVLALQELGDFDDGGRRRPVPIEGSSSSFLPTRWFRPSARVWTSASTAMRPRPTATPPSRSASLDDQRLGVFAAGDAVLGPATVVEAVAGQSGGAGGRRLLPWCGRAGTRDDRVSTTELTYQLDDYADAKRADARTDPAVRAHTYDDPAGFEEEDARRARRCAGSGV